MARRVIIRSRDLNTGVAQLEEMIKRDFQEIYKKHFEDLEDTADAIVERAGYIVPYSTGKLEASIDARVSKSKRYPGLIVTASAKNHGFDYALVQEENEDYSHEEQYSYGEQKPGDNYYAQAEQSSDTLGQRMAHYLGGSFAIELSYLYEELTGEELELPKKLQHAKDYVEDRGG